MVQEDTIVIRPLMQLSLTYDHRIVDGAPAALFLRRIKQLLETPGLLIENITEEQIARLQEGIDRMAQVMAEGGNGS